MPLDFFGNDPETNKTDKQDFSEINTDKILESSKRIQEIQEQEYADNVDNKITIPSDLKDYFPEDDVIIEGEEETEKFEKIKKEIYEKLGLNEILEENTNLQKFEKGLLDGGILDNIEMLGDLANSSIEQIIGIIKQLSNWETIKAILIDIYDSIEDITKVFQNPYDGGVALGALGIGPLSKSLKGLSLTKKIGKKENIELLRKYSESLGEELKLDDIIGEGNNAIIVAHPTKIDKVLKIAKEGREIDRLDIEFENHSRFRFKLKELKNEYKSDNNINNFYIPGIKNYNGIEGIYEMDKINGLSLKSLVHIEFNKEKLKIPSDLYEGLSQEQLLKFFSDNGLGEVGLKKLRKRGINDNDIMTFLKRKGLVTYPEAKDWYKEKNKPYVENFIRTWFSNKIYKEKITPFNDILKSHGFNHNDIHWGNYMIGEKGEINMLDFGNSKIK